MGRDDAQNDQIPGSAWRALAGGSGAAAPGMTVDTASVARALAMTDTEARLSEAAERLAIAESLEAHGLSVRARLDRLNEG